MFKSFIDRFQEKVEYKLIYQTVNLAGYRLEGVKTFSTELAALDYIENEIKPNNKSWKLEILKVKTTQALVYKKEGEK